MSASEVVEIAGRRLPVSSLDRVLWPETGGTKAELMNYYVSVAPALLPHLADRPLTLHRFPEGVTGPHFFQTRCPPHPEWLPTATMSFPRTGKTFEAAVVNDLPALVWAANLSTIEFHPFLGRAERLAEPTTVVFDLDPGPPADLLDACRTALALRSVLDDVGLSTYPKTSGGKGLHVYVPLNEPHTYDETKAFARGVARVLVEQQPERVVDRMTRSLRRGKVLIDWSQNDPGKSTVSPYSLPGLPTPAVSMPLRWAEVEDAVAAADLARLVFLPSDVLPRLDDVGDLFAPVLRQPQRLPAAG